MKNTSPSACLTSMLWIQAADQAEFVTPGNWVDALPLEGNFTVDDDRALVMRIGGGVDDECAECGP